MRHLGDSSPQVTELILCSRMPGFLMLTWVLRPLRYTRIQALSPAMGAALYVLQLTSRIPVHNTTQRTVAFRTWLCFVMEVEDSPTSSTLPNLQRVQDEAAMWFP